MILQNATGDKFYRNHIKLFTAVIVKFAGEDEK
ncbi:MAG: hypothetical protein JWR54_3042 [Mucilaginibacter sp.]|nr:hypothetical protein [Mucilaginibacter sp.]